MLLAESCHDLSGSFCTAQSGNPNPLTMWAGLEYGNQAGEQNLIMPKPRPGFGRREWALFGILSGLLFFLEFDVQLIQLQHIDPAWGIGHDTGGGLGFGEGDHIAD